MYIGLGAVLYTLKTFKDNGQFMSTIKELSNKKDEFGQHKNIRLCKVL